MPFIPHIRPQEQPDVPRPVTGNPATPRADLRGVMGAAGQLGQSAQQPGIPTEPFMAPGKGLQILGEQINGVGDLFAKLEAKRLEAQSERQVAEAEVALDNKRAEFESWKLGHPDPTTWQPHWEALSQDALDTVLQSPSLGTTTRNRIQLSGVRWRGHGSVAVKTAATKREFELAGNAYLAKAETARLSGDEPTHEAALTLARDKGYISEVDVVREREKFREYRETETQHAAIESAVSVANTDPESAAEIVNDPKFGTNLKPTTVQLIRNRVQAAQGDSFRSAQADVFDSITTGTDKQGMPVLTPEDVSRVAGKRVRPHELKKLQDDLMQFHDEAKKAEMSTPENQRALFGELLDRAGKFDREALGGVSGEAARNEYADILGKTKWLDPVLRGEISKPLAAKWFAAAPKVEGTVKEYVSQSVKDYFEAGTFGATKLKVPKVQGDEGFVSYETRYKEVTDEAGLKAARIKMADAQIALNDWMEKNPKASREDATAALFHFAGQGIRKEDSDAILKGADQKTTPPPAFDSIRQRLQQPAGAQGDTGPQGTPVAVEDARITSYGYANDETPDSNSSAGIGAWVPDDEAVKIKAGQASGYKLRAGDIAVSPDIEEKFRAAGIIPGEQVTVTYKDGSTHTGRWMDRTANDAQAAKLGLKPLRGRFDIYSPRGRHARDGQKVVSFSAPGEPPALYSQAAAN